MSFNPYNRYKEQAVTTMTQGEMVVLMYDEIISQLNRAVLYIDENNLPQANNSLQKCQRILNHLSFTLDYKYELSGRLASLYDYFIRQIIKSNIKKETEPIKEILPLLVELKETFAQGERLSRMK